MSRCEVTRVECHVSSVRCRVPVAGRDLHGRGGGGRDAGH